MGWGGLLAGALGGASEGALTARQNEIERQQKLEDTAADQAFRERLYELGNQHAIAAETRKNARADLEWERGADARALDRRVKEAQLRAYDRQHTTKDETYGDVVSDYTKALNDIPEALEGPERAAREQLIGELFAPRFKKFNVDVGEVNAIYGGDSDPAKSDTKSGNKWYDPIVGTAEMMWDNATGANDEKPAPVEETDEEEVATAQRQVEDAKKASDPSPSPSAPTPPPQSDEPVSTLRAAEGSTGRRNANRGRDREVTEAERATVPQPRSRPMAQRSPEDRLTDIVLDNTLDRATRENAMLRLSKLDPQRYEDLLPYFLDNLPGSVKTGPSQSTYDE